MPTPQSFEPPDPFPDRRISREVLLANAALTRIGRKVVAGEPVDIEPGGYRSLTEREAEQVEAFFRAKCGPDPLHVLDDPELDEWRATYGRLDRVNDYPLRIIDWRPIAAGIALVAAAVAAHWTVRRGR